MDWSMAWLAADERCPAATATCGYKSRYTLCTLYTGWLVWMMSVINSEP